MTSATSSQTITPANSQQRESDFQFRFDRRLEEAKTNLAIAGDILCGEYTIDDNIKHYSLPRNVMLLRMKTIAYQSVQIAKVPFDSKNKNHAMLTDLHKNNKIDETAEKYNVGRNDMILAFAELAYRAIDKAYEDGYTNETLCRIMAYNNCGNGLSMIEAIGTVAKESRA